MSEQYFFMTVCATTSSEGSSQSTAIGWANMRSSPFGPSKRPLGPVKPCLANDAAVDGAHPRHPGGEALPLRYCMHTGERDIVDGRDGDGIRDFSGGEPQELPCARGRGDRELNGVVESFCHHRNDGCQPTLDFVCYGKRQHEFLARRPCVLGGGKVCLSTGVGPYP